MLAVLLTVIGIHGHQYLCLNIDTYDYDTYVCGTGTFTYNKVITNKYLKYWVIVFVLVSTLNYLKVPVLLLKYFCPVLMFTGTLLG